MDKLKGKIDRHEVAKVLFNTALRKRYRARKLSRDLEYWSDNARGLKRSAESLEEIMEELNLPKPCRCDSCDNKVTWTLGEDEVGAGNKAERCTEGHWNSNGPQSEEEEIKCASCKEVLDIWANCKDFDVDWRKIKGEMI